jgi:hypothetical protein
VGGPGAAQTVLQTCHTCCCLLLELLEVLEVQGVQGHRGWRLWALLLVMQMLLAGAGLLPVLVRWRRRSVGPGPSARMLLQVLLLQVRLALLGMGREGLGAAPVALPALMLAQLELLVALQVVLLQLLVLLRLQDRRALLLALLLALRGAGAVRVGAVQVALVGVAAVWVAAGQVAVGQGEAARPWCRPLLHPALPTLCCCRRLWVPLAHGPSCCRLRCLRCSGGLDLLLWPLPQACKAGRAKGGKLHQASSQHGRQAQHQSPAG